MTLRALLSGCWFSHDRVLARDTRNELIYRCNDCREEWPVLQSEVLRTGPAHRQAEIPGKPLTKTFGGTVESFQRKRA